MTNWFLAAWLGACAADGVTTARFLQHGEREAVMTQSLAVNTSILAAEAATGVWLAHVLTTHGHPKLARVLLAVGTTTHGAAAWHNTR